MHFLVLQGFHERFAFRIVVGISFPAHADVDLVVLQQVRVVLGGVLDASIGVMYQARTGRAAAQGHAQSRNRQFVLQAPIQRPSDDAA
jgi:hypothetical protein